MDYKVADTEMISVANAIRTKGGTQAQLEWPVGYVNAVNNIETGHTFISADEGKVVQNADLVAQTSTTKTVNGTYDTTYNNEVVVNVTNPVSVVIGLDTTDDNEYAVSVDGSGNLVKTKLPTSIAVDTEPTKKSYADGETIDYSGMVVKAYNGDDSVYGTIPASELTLTEITADASKAHSYRRWAGLDVVDGATERLSIAAKNTYYVYGDIKLYLNSGNSFIVSRNGGSEICRYSASYPDLPCSVQFTVSNNGITVNYRDKDGSVNRLNDETSAFTSAGLGPATITGSSDKSQMIPVSWNRPVDGTTLSTSFGIEVSTQ